MVYFNPFLIQFFEKNPFLSEDRHFPIDSGYKRNYEYNINIAIPEGYDVQELPAAMSTTLPNNLGILKFQTSSLNNSITVYFKLQLNHSYFKSEYYQELKELFKNAIDLQNNSLIILKSNNS